MKKVGRILLCIPFLCMVSLVISLSLLPVAIIHAASLTCPEIQNGVKPDNPLLPSPNNKQTPSNQMVKAPLYAPDRIIVKLRDSITEPADVVFDSGKSFAHTARNNGGELDELNRKYGVKSITLLFKNFIAGEKDKTRVQTRAGRKEHFAKLFAQSKARHAVRAARVAANSESPDISHIYTLLLPEGTDILAACKEYKANPHIEYAVPSYLMQPQSLPNDPYFSSRGSWGNSFDDMWALKRIKADVAWDTAQGEGVVVAVVDSGLDYNHVDIAANVWSNPAEVSGVPAVDDDLNGFTDDLRGWHFEDGYISNNDVMDTTGHGTFVAGIIGAVGNNGTGIIGVAPQAKIMPVKAFSTSMGIYSGYHPNDPFANSILYAAHNGADVINLSWGCSDCFNSPAIADAISVANALGVVVVAAAGDRGTNAKDAFPAMIQDVITVSSTDQNDDYSLYSNRGYLVDVAAPGGNSGLSYNADPDFVSILSLQSTVTLLPESKTVAPGYLRSAGTSASAAYVSGVVALVLSANPSLSREQVMAIIKHSADDQVGNPSKDAPGYDPYFGWGRVNAARAVSMALSPPSDPPVIMTQPAGFSFVVPKLLCPQQRSFSFDIFNVGGSSLNWNLTTPGWITPAATSGTAVASPVMTMDINQSTDGSIALTSNGGSAAIPVSVLVQPDMKLSTCPTPFLPGIWDIDRNVNPPAIADGAGGAYYVTYFYDYTLFRLETAIQHIDSNGTPLWGANGLKVSSSVKSKHGPAITSDGTGGAIVLWIEDNNTGSYGDANLRAQRISSSGELLWGSAGISVTRDGWVDEPVIIPDGSGGAIIGWYSVATYDPFLQRVSASGALLWDKNGVPVSRAVDGQFDMALAEDGNGGAYAVWTDRRTSWYEIYGQHVSGDGVPLWDQDGKHLSSGTYYSVGGNVVADGAGGAIFAWHDLRNHHLYPQDNSINRNDIYAVHLNAAGEHLWDSAGVPVVSGFRAVPARVSLSGGPTRLNMISDGQGGAIMAWLDIRSRQTTVNGKWDIYAQKINAAGQPVWAVDGIAAIAADGGQNAPALIPDGDGGALFAWHDNRFGNTDVFIQQMLANGALRWGSAGVWVQSGARDQVAPYLVHLGGNRLAISWNEQWNGLSGEVVQLCSDHDGDGKYAEGGVCGPVNSSDPALTILRSGTGLGSVQSLPSGINCGADCSGRFAMGSVVTLKATPAPNSVFSGWTGGDCGGTGECTVILGADTSVQAIFTTSLPVKIAENQANIYTSPQHAYNNALSGNTIISRAYSFSENLNLNQPVSVQLVGGYDADFVGKSNYTEINGSVTVSQGTVTIDNFVIK
jgi:subtilisin family serine protease